MLKALDDLERAISRLEERAREKASGETVPGHGEGMVERTSGSGENPESKHAREEAAELIRRAIGRLRSL